MATTTSSALRRKVRRSLAKWGCHTAMAHAFAEALHNSQPNNPPRSNPHPRLFLASREAREKNRWVQEQLASGQIPPAPSGPAEDTDGILKAYQESLHRWGGPQKG